jgi:pimeloyl-ACP methyl ester carboxylesterase
MSHATSGKRSATTGVFGLVALALAAVVFMAPDEGTASHADPEPVSLESCTVDGPTGAIAARCGWVAVDETLGAPNTRTIELRVIVVPATGPASGPPLFFVPGGPGESASPRPGLLAWMAPLRERRDLVFVDPRGTGESRRLDCPPSNDPLAGAALWPVAEVRACVKALSHQADLTRYTSEELARDLDSVRRALGFPAIDLLAFSGGTRVAMELTRGHPEGVRQAILVSVVPFDMDMPSSFPRDMESALDQLVEDCAADAACGAAYPNLRADLVAVFAKLRHGSVKVQLPAVAPGTLTVRYGPAADAVRSMLYSIFLSADLPRTIHRAAEGDFVPLATAIAERTRSVTAISTPVYLSSTCAEDLPWVDMRAARKVARGTVLATTRLDAQSAACGVWPKRKVAAAFRVPLATDIPVLAISGALDPATPPRLAEHALLDMTNAAHLVVPVGSHSEHSPCVVGILRQFLERGTVDGVDTACLGDARRPPFVVD